MIRLALAVALLAACATVALAQFTMPLGLRKVNGSAPLTVCGATFVATPGAFFIAAPGAFIIIAKTGC